MRLDSIRARAHAATEGPWEVIGGGEYISGPGDIVLHNGGVVDADAEFIAHAREDIPRLLAALDAVETLCEEARVILLPSQIRAAITGALGD